VKDSLRDPANLSAALEYYRATLNPAEHTVPEFQAEEDAIGRNPSQPHLYLHGEKDGCMGVEIAHLAAPLMTTPGSFVEIIETGGHFLHLEEPKFVNRSIINFLT
jgi:pimeloyl-ACP methyl ester carboxylesterase